MQSTVKQAGSIDTLMVDKKPNRDIKDKVGEQSEFESRAVELKGVAEEDLELDTSELDSEEEEEEEEHSEEEEGRTIEKTRSEEETESSSSSAESSFSTSGKTQEEKARRITNCERSRSIKHKKKGRNYDWDLTESLIDALQS